MLIRVVVDSPSDFDTWLTEQASGQRPPSPDDRMARAFFSQSCVNCHRVRGTPAQGDYAPDLTHLMSRQTIASGMVPSTQENLRRWVEARDTIKERCLMPSFRRLSDQERENIVEYLLTLR